MNVVLKENSFFENKYVESEAFDFWWVWNFFMCLLPPIKNVLT